MNRNSSKTLFTSRQQQQRGVSLIECSMVLAIAGILAGSALPSFTESLDKRKTEGIASEVRSDLMFARSEAVARNTGVRVSFYEQAGAAGRCYVIHTGNRADCRCDGDGPAVCSGDAVAIKTVHAAAASPRGVQVVANVSSMRFDPTHGTTTPAGTVCTVPASGKALHHVVNIMGRVRNCQPAVAGAPCAPC